MCVTGEVSVLFSEPKIPQHNTSSPATRSPYSFSALQRAENSSTQYKPARGGRKIVFQCSSASRKFLNRPRSDAVVVHMHAFQCSSASRKFLNAGRRRLRLTDNQVSVLFSEPKIPQPVQNAKPTTMSVTFQCSSASRKFLNQTLQCRHLRPRCVFQCSSASRKFLNRAARRGHSARADGVSVLFSEPKIPQSPALRARQRPERAVSVLFSEPKIPQSANSGCGVSIHAPVSVLFSEPKIPQ